MPPQVTREIAVTAVRGQEVTVRRTLGLVAEALDLQLDGLRERRRWFGTWIRVTVTGPADRIDALRDALRGEVGARGIDANGDLLWNLALLGGGLLRSFVRRCRAWSRQDRVARQAR